MKTQRLILPAMLLMLSVTACNQEAPDTMVGTLERDRVELKVESNEAITAIHFEDGDSVKPGDIILEQDSSRAQARLDQLSAVRDQATARLAELQRGPRPEAIREAQARLQADDVLAANAKSDLARAQDIFDRGLSNQSDLDRARTTWQTAVARAQADREALSALLNGTTVEELQQAQAALDAAEAGVRLAEIDLQRLTLTSPAGGVIDKVLFEVGERPVAGTTVAVVLDDQRLFARIYVPEPLKAQITVGTKLDVRVDGTTGSMQGTVSWVSADASFTPYFALTEHDRSRLSFLAEVVVDNSGNLPVGLPLEAWLPGNEPR